MSSKWPNNAKNECKTHENPTKTYNNAYWGPKTGEVGFLAFSDFCGLQIWAGKGPKSLKSPNGLKMA